MSASVREQLQEVAMQVQELGDIDRAIASAQRQNRTFAVAAVLGMTCVGILAAVIFSAVPGDSQPEPLRPPTPSPSNDAVVHGWPDTTRNAPGVYSLDGLSCGLDTPQSSCNHGWMHNGYGSSDVDITIKPDSKETGAAGDAGGSTREGGASVVVAGHDGIYQRIDARRERWIVDIEGTTIAINLVADPGASRLDLAEAHAIIDSMYSEPTDNDLGIRLVFTLTTNDWDSG